MSKLNLRSRPQIIAITNQKGGVGKTTTAINLAAALVERGGKVLVVDSDPQGNASTGLGIFSGARGGTTYDLLLESAPLKSVVHNTRIDGLDIVPATTDLSSADFQLVTNESRSFLMRNALNRHSVGELGYDYVLIDCPPSLSLLTVNAMIAAHSVLIPLQSEYFALEGLSQLMLTIREIRQSANRSLRIEGVLLTMYDKRNNLAQQVERDARDTLGELVFEVVVPRNVRVSEAPSHALSVLQYDTTSRGSQAYRALAADLLSRHGDPEPLERVGA